MPRRHFLPLLGELLQALITAELVKQFIPQDFFFQTSYIVFLFFSSTADILTIMTERVYEDLDRPGKIRAVDFGISKAFKRSPQADKVLLNRLNPS